MNSLSNLEYVLTSLRLHTKICIQTTEYTFLIFKNKKLYKQEAFMAYLQVTEQLPK